MEKNSRDLEDPFEMLINSFNNSFPLNNIEKEAIRHLFKKRILKRKYFLLQEGDICKYFTFVVLGCFKMYAIDNDFKEYNLEFVIENDWVCDLQSFYNKKPSKFYI